MDWLRPPTISTKHTRLLAAALLAGAASSGCMSTAVPLQTDPGSPGQSFAPPVSAQPTASLRPAGPMQSPAESPKPSPRQSPPITSAQPADPTPATDPTMTTSPTVVPSDEPAPTDRVGTWRSLGQIDPSDGVGWVTAFDHGYVAVSAYGSPIKVWFSETGTAWQATDLGGMVTPCPGWTPRPDATVEEVVDLGDKVLLLGSEYDATTTRCDDEYEGYRSAAWLSADGRHWDPVASSVPDGVQIRVRWPYGSGWLALGTEHTNEGSAGQSVVLQSDDGLSWSSVAALGNRIAPYDMSGPGGAGAANKERTALVITQTVEDNDAPYGEATVISLRVSDDGTHWRDTTAPFTGHFAVEEEEMTWATDVIAPTEWIEPPSSLSSLPSPWLVVVQKQDGTTVWSTTDFEHWTSAAFPRPTLDFVVATPFGLIAQGRVECYYAGSPCPLERQRQYLSTDGANWTSLDPHMLGELTVVGGSDNAVLVGHRSGRVWYLEPVVTGP